MFSGTEEKKDSSKEVTGEKVHKDSEEICSIIPIPEGYLCPISQEIFQEPVVASDGHTYEKHNIVEWLRRGNNRSPMTGERFSSDYLVPNYTLKSMVADFKQKIPEIQKRNQIRVDLEEAIKLREQFIRELLEKMEVQKKEKVAENPASFWNSKDNDFHGLAHTQQARTSSVDAGSMQKNGSSSPSEEKANNEPKPDTKGCSIS